MICSKYVVYQIYFESKMEDTGQTLSLCLTHYMHYSEAKAVEDPIELVQSGGNHTKDQTWRKYDSPSIIYKEHYLSFYQGIKPWETLKIIFMLISLFYMPTLNLNLRPCFDHCLLQRKLLRQIILNLLFNGTHRIALSYKRNGQGCGKGTRLTQ